MMNYTCCWVKQVPVRFPIWCSQIKIYEQAPLIELMLSQFQLDFFLFAFFFASDILWIFWSLKTHFKSIKFKITQFYKLYVVIKSADVLFFHLLVIPTWYALYLLHVYFWIKPQIGMRVCLVALFMRREKIFVELFARIYCYSGVH